MWLRGKWSWVIVHCAFNPLNFLVLDPLSHRKFLPYSIKMPEEVMAVTWRRKNTASSCQNTQSVVITASLPDIGTQSCRCLRMDFSYLAAATSEHSPAKPRDGSFQLKCTMEMCWDLSSCPGDSQANSELKALFVGPGLGRFWLFAQNSEKHYSLILLPASVDQNLY